MSHEITIREDGFAEMGYLKGTYRWHGLGNEFEAGASIEEIQRAAGLDWECEKRPLTYEHDGKTRFFSGRVAQVRSDTGEAIGLVSNRYKTVQPREVVEFFRDLSEGLGLQITTAGSLFRGARVYTSAYISEQSVIADRDRLRSYLLLTTSLDGSLPTTARFTMVSVLCANTMTMAFRASPPLVRVVHRETFDPKTVKETLGVAPRTMDQFMDSIRLMARTPMDELTVEYATEKLLGKDSGPNHARIVSLASGEDLTGNDVEGRSGGTVWSWVNAVTQFYSHERKMKSESQKLASSLFGAGEAMKLRALEIASELVDA